MVADYRSDPATVLATAIWKIVIGEGGLDILGACQIVSREGGLPSWMPYLKCTWKAMPFETSREGGGRSSELSVTSTDTGNGHVKGGFLVLRGRHMDAIAHISGDSFVRNNASTESLDAVFAS